MARRLITRLEQCSGAGEMRHGDMNCSWVNAHYLLELPFSSHGFQQNESCNGVENRDIPDIARGGAPTQIGIVPPSHFQKTPYHTQTIVKRIPVS